MLFPFGYGLSYSKFDYSNINIKNLGDYNIEVSVDVTNTGNMKAKETVLLFVNKEVDNVYRSVTELKGFEKVELDVNETKTRESWLSRCGSILPVRPPVWHGRCSLSP